jgi:putative flippase GtrA
MSSVMSQGGRRARVRELARYGVVGGGIAAIEYALYIALIGLWPQAVLAASLVARVAAGAVGFVGHSRFTFGQASLSTRSGVRYAASVVVNAALASLLLMALLPLLGPIVAKLASDAVVIAAGYLTGRTLVFAPASRREVVR